MKAPLRNPFIRIALFAGVVSATFLAGWLHGAAQADAAGKAELAKQARAKRILAAREMASIKNLPPEMRRYVTSVQLGNVTLGTDQMGRVYIDGEDLSKLGLLDLSQAIALLAKLPHGAKTSEVYRRFFLEWAEANPGMAATAAAGLPPGPEQLNAMLGVADAWLDKDPVAALNWATTLSVVDGAVLQETLINASKKDPALAIQYLGKLTDASLRSATILAIAQNWGNGNAANPSIQDPGAALAWLDQAATGATYDKAVQSIFANLARNDPASGASLVDELIDPVDRKAAIAQLGQSWGKQNPATALNWLQSLPPTDNSASIPVVQSIISSWSKSDLQAAANYMQQVVTDGTMFDAMVPALAPAMAKQDPQAALNWASGFPDSASKDQAISGVLATIAATDFSSAWNYASSLPTGSGRDGAMESVIATLSSTDPAKAAGLLGQLGPGRVTGIAITAVTSNWAKSDPAGLSTWIGSQPAGWQRDSAVTQYVKVQAANNPAAAYALANTIADESMRATNVRNSILEMAKTDLAAATRAAQTANIPDIQRQNILIQISKTQGK